MTEASSPDLQLCPSVLGGAKHEPLTSPAHWHLHLSVPLPYHYGHFWLLFCLPEPFLENCFSSSLGPCEVMLAHDTYMSGHLAQADSDTALDPLDMVLGPEVGT